jgi:plastocyanin
VQAGTAVIWTNRDDIAHTVTSGIPGQTTGVFDSADKTLGQAFTHTFPDAGTFSYFCKNHNSMTGRVTVT